MPKNLSGRRRNFVNTWVFPMNPEKVPNKLIDGAIWELFFGLFMTCVIHFLREFSTRKLVPSFS